MNVKELIEALHPLERKVLPFLAKAKTLSELSDKSGLKEVEAMRALQWLENKSIIKIISSSKELVSLDKNGLVYAKKGLPEKRFLKALEKGPLTLDQVMKTAALERPELNASIGLLRKKVAIDISPEKKISLTDQGKKVLAKKWLEEVFLEKISGGEIEISTLKPEEKFSLEIFKKRNGIIKLTVRKIKTIQITKIGTLVGKSKIKASDLIERVTQDMLKKGTWKNKKFRKYDVSINVPSVNRGKRHFVNQSKEYIKNIWLEMGFKEMSGSMLQTSFWNFDALFTAQDHPVREMQDTFFIKQPPNGKLPDKKIVAAVKEAHTTGKNVDSTGWKYEWKEDNAKKNVLRTHTTVLSAQTIANLKESDLPAKFFSVNTCFRNETVDWSHLFEFHQVEGIVIDPNATFKHLIGYLKAFYKKMGYDKIRIRPAYFPYTEPSVEVDVFHPVHKKWMELGGAGIFRPEVVIPLLGKDIPVLAWGQGLERGIMEYFDISDVRNIYGNNLKQIREMKDWMK